MAKSIAPEEGVIEQEMYGGKVIVRFLGPTLEKPGRHIYMVNGKRKTGVTTYIGVMDKSAALVPWATELYRDFLLENLKKGITEEHIYEGCDLHLVRKQEAADIGSQAHDWIERFILGQEPEMPDVKEVQIAVNAFLDWMNSNKVKFLSSERVIYSKKYDFVGKMDIEAKVNGKLCLIDIKTSNGLYNTYNMQTAAYVKADEEESNRKYQGRWLIRIAKETEKEYDKRMAKKNANRARKGKGDFDYPPYQVFEAKFLDDDAGNMERDYKAFLACKTLKEWDNATGFWANKTKEE